MSGGFRTLAGEFKNEIRWTVVVVALAALGVVALWPRQSAEEQSHPGLQAQQGQSQQAKPPPTPDQAVDEGLRRQAATRPCPTGGPGQVATQLQGVSGTCLADGKRTDLAAAVQGRATLINVWASWCAPCRTELPVLETYTHQPGAVSVLGVQVLSDQADGLKLMKELGVHFPTLHEGSGGQLRSALEMPNVLPASYLVTAAGEVRRMPPMTFRSPDEVHKAVHRTLETAK